jgi:hypothetical protein
MWGAAAWLFPEVLNPLVREELGYLGELPEWAMADNQYAAPNV